jgi:hypothetical protein
MSSRYRYYDLDCHFCADIVEAGCPFALCPHILENLKDLQRDPQFIDAVEDEGDCVSYHTPTLMYLNSIGFPDERAMWVQLAPPDSCGACQFPRVGLTCHSADGTCLKTDYNAALDRSRKPCPA